MVYNLTLTGFSGTGKSEVGRLVARAAGLEFIDTDDEIVREAGKPIAEIFEQDGEAHFRRLERDVIARACTVENRVISTGGGAIVDNENFLSMFGYGFIVCLDATPETIHRRLEATARDGDPQAVRPLLNDDDPLKRITELKAQRQRFYDLAHWSIQTDDLTPEQVAREVLSSVPREEPAARDTAGPGGFAPSFTISTESATYPVFVEWGILESFGERLRHLGFDGPVFVITDSNVASPHGERLESALRDAGIESHCYVVPAGEASKSISTAEAVYSWLADHRCERRNLLVALGGGMVGDLTGFVAATFLRGVPFIQAPTSLAAMVDASIGGKTAVNLSVGKNLVGAFYQPRAVMADLDTLKTLSYREMASGWAEAIKHGLILDASLFETFEESASELMELQPGISSQVIRRSMEIKARVVEEDEKETLGRRVLLNYGHTTGHALEAVTHYNELLHGEAVAIGMRAAAEISRRMGMLSSEAAERQNRLLMQFGLPTSSPGSNPEDVLRAIELDKKASSKAINWVLMEEIGRVSVRSDVPQDLVRQVVEEVCS